MNKSIFIGRMATDPKVMSSAGKKTVAYFRIAVERKFRQEGAPNADYFSCVTFGERAEFVDSKDESENVSQNGRTNRNSSQSSRNSGSNNNGRSSQNPGNSYQNSPYYKNTNQGKTNCTGSKPQRAQSSRQNSQNRYNVDEKFMNMGNEEMGDFC